MGQRASPHQTSTTMTAISAMITSEREQPPAEACLGSLRRLMLGDRCMDRRRPRRPSCRPRSVPARPAAVARCRPRGGACPRRPAGTRGELACLLVRLLGGGLCAVLLDANRTAVMLSSPPPRFAAWISAFAPASRSSRCCAMICSISSPSTYRREAVAADQEDVTRLRQRPRRCRCRRRDRCRARA